MKARNIWVVLSKGNIIYKGELENVIDFMAEYKKAVHLVEIKTKEERKVK